jgi:DNA polymerase elongation subunit (family B)
VVIVITATGKDIYAFDVENDGKKLTLGSIVGKDKRFMFYSKQEFWDFIRTKKFRNKILYATNLEYDLGFLMDGIPVEKEIKVFRRGGRLIFARIKVNSKNCVTFADSMNFTPAGVKRLGEMVGLPKLEIDSFKTPTTQEGWDRLREYNIRDSTITYRFMEKLKKAITSLGGNMKITASSTSLHLFRKKYYDLKLKESRYADQEMKSYFGGRTEVFKRGLIKDINVYDVNSMYPHVMAENEYPLPHTAKRTYDPNFLEEGISYVTVECPKTLAIPLLPVRKGKIIFPTGRFSGWYCHPELRKARELGCRIKVRRSITYKTAPMFKGFMNDMYSKRLKYKREGNDIMQTTCKLFMNSLYGKFAIKPEEEKEIHESKLSADEVVDLLEDGYQLNTRGFFHFTQEMKKVPKYRMPIISSYVTSYARLLLYKYLEKAGDQVIYCDTDSIFTTGSLPTGDNLGEMKLEFQGDGIIIKPKMYMLNKNDTFKIKVKGLGRQIKTPEMFNKHIIGGDTLKYKRFAKIRESRVRGFWYGEPIECIKLMGLEDDKRNWTGSFTLNPQNSTPLNHISENINV